MVAYAKPIMLVVGGPEVVQEILQTSRFDMHLVVDAEYYVSVGHDGEDQRRVALADKADPGVAAVGGRGGVVEPGWVVGVVAGAYGFAAGIRNGVRYGEEELDGE